MNVSDKTRCFNLINFKMEFLPYSRWLKVKKNTEGKLFLMYQRQATVSRNHLDLQWTLWCCFISWIFHPWMRLTPLPELSNYWRVLATLQALFFSNIRYSPLLLFAAINWCDKEILLKSVKAENIIWIYRNHWGTLI